MYGDVLELSMVRKSVCLFFHLLVLAYERELQMANKEQDTDDEGLHILSGPYHGGLWIFKKNKKLYLFYLPL